MEDDRELITDGSEQAFDESVDVSEVSEGTGETNRANRTRREGNGINITDRLRNERNDDDEDEEQDLVIGEENVLQWLQAFDLQVIGACRADERLKPLLKMHVSSGAAEDRLLSHLIQHFDAAEVGMLARCFFMPLVSIRVGKVVKQGKLLCPTADRGSLNLILLPSSDFRISFAGDDGCTERLATLSSNCENSAVVIQEISADTSGRSFVLELPSRQAYFWCSEKSRILGAELLAKMKDLLKRKPSIVELTGISESRLECFAIHLHSYLPGSSVSNTQSNHSSSLLDPASEPVELDLGFQVSSSLSNISCQQYSDQATTCQLPVGAQSLIDISNSNLTDKEPSEVNLPCFPTNFSFLESLEEFAAPPSSNGLSKGFLPSQDDNTRSVLSPYYCWCPPSTSTLQNMTISSSAESLALPPLSSLSYTDSSSTSLLSWKPPFNLPDISSLDFPAFLPDPVVQLPLPLSSLATMPSSQQIPTFTPLMSDPIVHIPSIGICSSGPGYVIGAGHSIPTTMSSLHPHIVNPLITDTESIVEKGARDTLQLLLSSAQTNTWSLDVLPTDRSSTCDGYNMLVSGSGGVYSGTNDANTSFTDEGDIGMVLLPRKSDCDLVDSEKQTEGTEGFSENVK